MRSERRADRRERIFQRASVVFNGRQSMFDCAVRNLSETGAMVRLSDWTALPETFEIDMASGKRGIRVKQRWRRGDDVGVAFLTEQELQPKPVVSLARYRDARLGSG
jgi:hypothetical protein